MQNSEKSYSKNLSQPEERRDFRSHGHLDLVSFGDGSIVGRGVFEPGWMWSADVKPIAGTESCMAEHHGYCLSGSMVVRMDSGEEIQINPGDAFHLLPGHDAWVTGNERCELLDFTGFHEYAVPSTLKKAA